jgi:hypothetical protein
MLLPDAPVAQPYALIAGSVCGAAVGTGVSFFGSGLGMTVLAMIAAFVFISLIHAYHPQGMAKELTDRLASYVLRILSDSPQEIIDRDMNISFRKPRVWPRMVRPVIPKPEDFSNALISLREIFAMLEKKQIANGKRATTSALWNLIPPNMGDRQK